MIYSNDKIETVRKLAGVFLPINDIAFVIGVPPEELREDINTVGSEVSKAYHEAKIASKVRLLDAEMQLAKVGSPQAIENVRSQLQDMEDDEI